MNVYTPTICNAGENYLIYFHQILIKHINVANKDAQEGFINVETNSLFDK